MAIQFALPELGENIDSGTVTAVLVSVGDAVEKDQPVIELETDKAVVEVPAPEAGVVAEIHAKEGGTLRVGEVILVLNGAAVAEPVAAAAVDEVATEPGSPELEAGLEPPAPPVAEEEIVPAGPAEVAAAPPQALVPARPEGVEKKKRVVRASPSVRRLAREIGVEIQEVQPSTPGAALTADDVKAYARSTREQYVPAMAVAPKRATDAAPLPNFERWGPVTREKMHSVRRVTAESMTRSWHAAPHVTHNDKADITELEAFRKQYGPQAEAAGGKLTATAILVKVLASALKHFPQFNASADMANAEIVYKQYYNIGVAVDTEWGLLVPSIKNVDQKGLIDIAIELAELSERARRRKSSIAELQGGCITLTNLGGIGGTSFSPIIHVPEVAILGVSRGRVEPVYIDGEFRPRTLLPLSLSYDHRVIDGANAARFVRWICRVLEQPMTMFLEG